MALKFCANLSFMYQECPSLTERYSLAAAAGFKGVECAFPYDIPLDKLIAIKEAAGVEQVLINAFPGNWSAGERGIACLPGKEIEFRDSINQTVTYANALNCKRVHVMAGVVQNETDEHRKCYVERLRLAAKIFEENDIIGVIEPICKYAIPNYFLGNFEKAVSVLKEVDSKHLKLQVDFFHLQQISGNLTRQLDTFMPFIGHIQIAQVPDRHEPDTAGEIDYKYIFKQLEARKYDGWIGLEYTPATSTDAGLGWIKAMGYSL